MSTYVIVGASRGLGYEFLLHYASESTNTVFGLVRDKSAVDKKIQAEKLKNIHIIHADVCDRKSLQQAKAEVEAISTSVDYLINNAAYMPPDAVFISLDDAADDDELLEHELLASFKTNVVGIIDTIRTFLPLIRRGRTKKIITLSSAMSDIDFINSTGIYEAAPYSISKAALNVAVAKFSAKLKNEGVLFLTICPGVVDTGDGVAPPPELINKLVTVYQNFGGPISTQESVEAVTDVMRNANITKGNDGEFLSHFGNKHWM